MTRAGGAARLAGLVLLVGAVAVVAATVGVPGRAQLQADFAGPWGGPLFAVAYAGVSLSPLPKTVFTLAAGAIFGIAEGVPVVAAGAVAGAVLAFGIGRRLGRDVVRRLAGRRVARLDDALARRGFTAVLLARLVPVVPFTALNYVAGVTGVRLRDFGPATALGILPATTAYVTLGAVGADPGSRPFWLAVATLVALTAAGLVLGGRRHRAGRRSGLSRTPADGAGGPAAR